MVLGIAKGFHFYVNSYFSALVGETNTATNEVSVYTHKRFEIGYNGDNIVDVSVIVDGAKPVRPGQDLDFTYEITWKHSNVEFEKRFEKYLDPTFFQHRVSAYKIVAKMTRT